MNQVAAHAFYVNAPLMQVSAFKLELGSTADFVKRMVDLAFDYRKAVVQPRQISMASAVWGAAQSRSLLLCVREDTTL